jgi:RNA polymerase sigma-70 factor (ECF subfamily)
MLNNPKSTRYSSLPLVDVVHLCADACDDDAWDELVARVTKPLSLTIMRTASMWGRASREVVDDLVQATYLKLWQGGRTLLREFAIARPESVLGYLKRIAANATHDYFKHRHSQACGGENWLVSTVDVDPEAERGAHGSPDDIAFEIFLREIDEHLTRSLTGPDQERDRTIFWLYFRQGMSTREIASLPGMGLGTKGVGSVLERLKRSIREQILAPDSRTGVKQKANSIRNSYESSGGV